MKKFISMFISIWSILAVLSSATAIDFYIAIHENPNPTGEQALVSGLVIAFFALASLIFVGAHIEERNRKN